MKRNRPGRFAALLWIVGCGLLAAPDSGCAQFIALDALARSGYVSVPLKRPTPNVLAVDASINGHDVQMVVDTGCSHVLVRRILLSRFGLKTTAAQTKISGASGRRSEDGAQMATADRIRVGNMELTNVPIMFSELGTMNSDHSRGAPVGSYLPPASQRMGDGFLGADFLSACSAVIDLQNLKLYLRPPGHGQRVDLGPGLRGIGMTEIPFANADRNRYRVKVEVNGVPGAMLLDTGDYLTTLSASHAASLKLNGFHSRLLARDITGAELHLSRIALQSFKVGAFSAPTDDTLLLSNLAMGSEDSLLGILGMDVIGRNAGVIDCGQRKLYLMKTR